MLPRTVRVVLLLALVAAPVHASVKARRPPGKAAHARTVQGRQAPAKAEAAKTTPAEASPVTAAAAAVTAAAAAPAAPPASTPPPAPAPRAVPRLSDQPQALRAQHIVVAFRGLPRAPPGVTRTKEEARRRVQEALARAQEGEDWDALVREYTDEPGGAQRAGDLGVIEPGSLVGEVERVVRTLQPGAICPQPVESIFGFHVVRRLEAIPQVELRHILVAWQGAPRASSKIKRSHEDAKIRAAELYVQASQGTPFEDLARKESDDPASAPRGGFLGPVRHGVTIAAFEEAALQLEPGALKVIESPFGYHVLQRVR